MIEIDRALMKFDRAFMKNLRDTKFSSLTFLVKAWSRIALVITLAALFSACSNEKGGNHGNDTRYGAPPRQVKEASSDLGLFLSPSTKRSIEEVSAQYFPERKAHTLKKSDYLAGSDRAAARLDFESAVILCTEAIKLAPSDPEAYFKRGKARLDSSNSDSTETLADLEKAIRLNYRDSKAYELLAVVYDSRKEKDKALESIAKALEINPADSGLHKMKAAMHAAYGDIESAKMDYDAWVRLAPNHPLPYILRGQLLQSMKKYDAALQDFKMVCTLPEVSNSVSNRDMAFRLRAGLLSKLGRHKEAIEVIDEGLQQNRNEDELFRLRGDEYMFLKDFKKAIADYTQAIGKAPEFAGKALDARGKAYAALGDKVRAGKDFQKARELLAKPAEKPIY